MIKLWNVRVSRIERVGRIERVYCEFDAIVEATNPEEATRLALQGEDFWIARGKDTCCEPQDCDPVRVVDDCAPVWYDHAGKSHRV